MELTPYDLGSRIRYGAFIQGAVATCTALLVRTSSPRAHGFRVRASTLDPRTGISTAAVKVSRDAFGSLTSVYLYLPAMSPDRNITGELARELLGYLIHELGHMLMTGEGTVTEVRNVLEDYYIERSM
jgi:hypothetical protein